MLIQDHKMAANERMFINSFPICPSEDAMKKIPNVNVRILQALFDYLNMRKNLDIEREDIGKDVASVVGLLAHRHARENLYKMIEGVDYGGMATLHFKGWENLSSYPLNSLLVDVASLRDDEKYGNDISYKAVLERMFDYQSRATNLSFTVNDNFYDLMSRYFSFLRDVESGVTFKDYECIAHKLVNMQGTEINVEYNSSWCLLMIKGERIPLISIQQMMDNKDKYTIYSRMGIMPVIDEDIIEKITSEISFLKSDFNTFKQYIKV